MANPNRFAPDSLQSSNEVSVFPGSLRRCLPGLLLFSFCIFGSPIGHAQEQPASGQQDQDQQTQDQDVAKAAREERARKQANPSKPQHVYTAEDLKRDQILTPEDRAMFEASRRQWTPLVTQPSQDALDAQSLPPNAPLGDIARSLQRQKELMRLRRSNEFHLPLPDAPVLAAPKPSMEPLHAPLVIIEPARPNVVGQFHTPVKRSPFERPRAFAPEFVAPRTASPAIPNSGASPAAPEKPPSYAGTQSQPRVSANAPRASVAAPEMPRTAGTSTAPLTSPSSPKAPRNLNPEKPAQPFFKGPHAVVSAPPIYHVAPATPAVPVAPDTPQIPHISPASPPRPGLKAPHVVVPTAPVYHVVPTTPTIPVAPPVAPAVTSVINTGKVVTVQPGDSLWKIAEQHLGNGLRWQELLAVNPSISDPKRIIAGSQLALPPSVSAPQTTRYTVQRGDTLWGIAQSHLGRATAWSCVAKANAQLEDANFIVEGQVLVLPSSCPR